ncbi:MAG: hypothetical protein R2789_14480 [Microthrixaceae bacterium]
MAVAERCTRPTGAGSQLAGVSGSLYEHLGRSRSGGGADEHRSYFGPAFLRAVRDLSPQALVGLTATPHPKTDADRIVFHYPLAGPSLMGS